MDPLSPSCRKRTVVSVSDLREEVLSLYHTWGGCCGVMLFLYSVILTKVQFKTNRDEQTWMETLCCLFHITQTNVWSIDVKTKINIDLFPLLLPLQGIENIRNEIQDTMEPLIDPVHGHGRYIYVSVPFARSRPVHTEENPNSPQNISKCHF